MFGQVLLTAIMNEFSTIFAMDMLQQPLCLVHHMRVIYLALHLAVNHSHLYVKSTAAENGREAWMLNAN